jgi:hypothetical protein
MNPAQKAGQGQDLVAQYRTTPNKIKAVEVKVDKVEAGEAIGRGYYCGHGGHGYGGGCGGRGGHLAKVEEVSVVAVVVAMATIAVPNTLCSQWQVFAAFFQYRAYRGTSGPSKNLK